MAFNLHNDSSVIHGGGVGRSFLVSLDETSLPPPGSFSFVKRNLASEMHRITREDDSLFLPPPSPKETVSVYLRIKPKTPEESEFYSCRDESELANIEDDSFEVVKIESKYQIALQAPKDSNTYKNSINGAGSVCHRFTFSKIFAPETDQVTVFSEMVMPKLKEFLEGRNQLLFTYGATSSGKTFTIQGDAQRPGILPRALDSIFNSVKGRLMSEPSFKPIGFKGVGMIEGDEVRKVIEEKISVFKLGKELISALNSDHSSKSTTASMFSDTSQNCSQASQQSLATMFPQFSERVRETLAITLSAMEDFHYSIWVSFAEIYNENIYDLLEKMPEVKRKGDKPRRIPLKLAEESGCVYVRGLKEIHVSSADEAYQLMMIGRENLQFAATRLNHHSSRSHCIFTVKVIRVADKAKPNFARVSMLSFCDLAGSERIKKTLNTGDRQKEAGNINNSLLTLGRCIKAIRHNQMTKDPNRHQVIPFRDSKLTRLFQSFFTGRGLGKASMVVNVSQSPYLFDESLQVLKFAAIALKVNIEVHRDAVDTHITQASKDVKKRRQSQFSMMVLEKKAKVSLLSSRESIAWENPPVRSTMCPIPDMASTICEEDESAFIDNDRTMPNALEETTVDDRFTKLLDVIEELRNQLIVEKQKNLQLEAEVRKELCEEFNKMISEIEANCETRVQEEKDRIAEYSDWRVNKVEDAYKERSRNRKRLRQDDSEDENSESLRQKLSDLETKLIDKSDEVDQLKKQVVAMKTVHSGMLEEKQKQQEEITLRSFELSNARTEISTLQIKYQSSEDKLKETNKALEEQNSDSQIKILTREVTELKQVVTKLETENKRMKTLLDQAEEDFLEKTSQVEHLEKALTTCESQLAEQKLNCNDLESQVDEYRQLYSNANEVVEEKENIISELEEKIKLLQNQLDNQDISQKWAEKKSFEQEMTNLADEIESLKQDKEKLRSLLDSAKSELDSNEKEIFALQKEVKNVLEDKKKVLSDLESAKSSIVSKETEINDLQNEVKSLIRAEKNHQDVKNELTSEIEMLRKQMKEISQTEESLNNIIKEKQIKIGHMQNIIDSTKKEENAIDALRIELDRKNQEKSEAETKFQLLDSEIGNLRYDLTRAKAEKEELMHLYEKKVRKLVDDLAREKRETMALQNRVSTLTPSKSSNQDLLIQRLKEDCQKLRDELTQKSELVKTLSRKIAPTPNGKNDDMDEDLKDDNLKLTKEIEALRSKHAIEINTAKKGFEKILAEYKDTNQKLQSGLEIKEIGIKEDNIFDSSMVVEDGEASKVVEHDKMTNLVEDDKMANLVEDDKMANVVENDKMAMSVVGKRKLTTSTQVSFDDSTVENSHPDELRGSKTSPPRKAPRRGTRVSGTRPTRGGARPRGTVSFAEDIDNDDQSFDKDIGKGRSRKGSSSSLPPSLDDILQKPLKEIQLSPLNEAQDGSPVLNASRAPGRKKLFTVQKVGAVFTPPDTRLSEPSAHTILNRQLRARREKKK